MMKEVLYMKVSNDKYELPEAVAGSVKELALLLGITTNAIYSAFSQSKTKGYNNRYVKVVLDESE